jgi:short-subunit dehydrogenase involved in D-alanine esterification of teichoic acids
MFYKCIAVFSTSLLCSFLGIGKSIAQALLKCGAEVIILEKIEADLQKFKEEVIIFIKILVHCAHHS